MQSRKHENFKDIQSSLNHLAKFVFTFFTINDKEDSIWPWAEGNFIYNFYQVSEANKSGMFNYRQFKNINSWQEADMSDSEFNIQLLTL